MPFRILLALFLAQGAMANLMETPGAQISPCSHEGQVLTREKCVGMCKEIARTKGRTAWEREGHDCEDVCDRILAEQQVHCQKEAGHQGGGPKGPPRRRDLINKPSGA